MKVIYNLRCSTVFSFMFMLVFIVSSCNLLNSTDDDTAQKDPYNSVRENYDKKGRLVSTISYKDSVPDGLAYNYYQNGNVQAEFNYKKGKKHGEEKVFYENGDLYQVTQYVNGQKWGIQKKYYEGNRLMAEIPFEDNEVVTGLNEYTKSGKQKNKGTKIEFELVDKTAFENKFELKVRLSDGSKAAKFHQYFVDEKHEYVGKTPLETDNGIGTLSYFVGPGKSLVKKIYIVAERKTTLRNLEIFKDSFNLAVVNKKKFY